MRQTKSRRTGQGIYVDTSMRWNAMWSHSHELVKTLATHERIIYREPPALTTPRSTVLFDKTPYPRPDGVTYVGSPKKFKRTALAYFLTYTRDSREQFLAHKDEFDIFLTYNVYELGNLHRARRLGKKVVFVYADEYDELTTLPLLKPFLKHSLRQFLSLADIVICTAKVLYEKARLLNKNVLYIPNGVNLEDAKGKIGKLHHIVSAKKKSFVVGFVGAIESWVDTELFAQAIQQAEREHPAIQFHIVGDGASAPNFKTVVASCTNVTFHGYVPHAEVYKHIASWDAAVIPFKINTITNSVSPVKLFEYWLMKTPVLTTKTVELMQYDKELVLFDSSGDLVQKLHKLSTSPQLQRTLGERGNAIVTKRANWGVYGARYKEIIASLRSPAS